MFKTPAGWSSAAYDGLVANTKRLLTSIVDKVDMQKDSDRNPRASFSRLQLQSGAPLRAQKSRFHASSLSITNEKITPGKEATRGHCSCNSDNLNGQDKVEAVEALESSGREDADSVFARPMTNTARRVILYLRLRLRVLMQKLKPQMTIYLTIRMRTLTEKGLIWTAMMTTLLRRCLSGLVAAAGVPCKHVESPLKERERKVLFRSQPPQGSVLNDVVVKIKSFERQQKKNCRHKGRCHERVKHIGSLICQA